MNKWGTPAWRDIENYGLYQRWTDRRWRWEFLRRSPEYRSDFDALAAPYRERFKWTPELGEKISIAHAALVWPNFPEEKLVIFSDEERQNLEAIAFSDPECVGFSVPAPDPGKYGLWSLLNPAIDDHGNDLEFAEYDGLGFFDDGEPWQTVMTFDLRMPIAAQIAKAQDELLDAQYKYAQPSGDLDENPIRAERIRRNDRIVALRAIDAKEQEPSIQWHELAEVLWPGQEKAPSRADEAYRRGCRLRHKHSS